MFSPSIRATLLPFSTPQAKEGEGTLLSGELGAHLTAGSGIPWPALPSVKSTGAGSAIARESRGFQLCWWFWEVVRGQLGQLEGQKDQLNSGEECRQAIFKAIFSDPGFTNNKTAILNSICLPFIYQMFYTFYKQIEDLKTDCLFSNTEGPFSRQT